MARIKADRIETEAGGGAFRLDDLTVGVFLKDQPAHRLGLGSDRSEAQPLSVKEGWILPAGAEGLCEYDAAHEFVAVSVPGALLAEVGFRGGGFAPVVGQLDPVLTELAISAPALGSAATIYRETMQRALAAQIAQVLDAPPPEVAGIDDRRLRRAVARIHDDVAADISLDGLAAEAGMSPYHFARAFKAAIGASPLQYVIAARIEQAQVLLKTTDLPVAEIAWRVGYEDVSRFGRHFKRQVGATPGAFRSG